MKKKLLAMALLLLPVVALITGTVPLIIFQQKLW